MSHSNSFSLAHVLASPWQQRRNTGGLWGIVLVVALCFSAPVVLLTWSLFSEPGQQTALLRIAAGRSAWVGFAALLVAGWAILVGNVLRQNHPTIARLVPHHPGQLRLALLVAWALLSLVAAALPGFAFDAPLGWACGVAAALALLAACLRWPVLWLLGIVSPFVVGWLTRRYSAAGFIEAFESQWSAHQVLVTGVVVMAGATVLTLLIRTGGTAHDASYQAGRRLGQAFSMGCIGGRPTSLPGWWRFLGSSVARPYARWMAHLLARGDSPVMSRLLLGLGPATHWTTRIFEAFWFLVLSLGICGVVGSLVGGGEMLASILPFLCFSVLTGVCTPVLQAVSRLHQSGREQALLVLLPGVPRGARLNRWLALQMSLTFVVAALCGLALAWALGVYADSFKPGLIENTVFGMVPAIAASLLPQVAWQWRRWAHLRGTRGTRETLPTLTPVLLGGAAMALHWFAGIGYVTFGVVAMAVSLAWCAWRWHRMASEPTALPVGRLA